jgi:hypothetical protein
VFDDWKIRASLEGEDNIRMQPEDMMRLKKTRFTAMLIEANGFDPNGFRSWVFCPAMLFNSPDKWWGDHGLRDFPHEGIDFCLYEDATGKRRRLDEKTLIPAMHDGVVRAMFTDYLGQAVIVEHESIDGKSGRYLSVYAHTEPQEHIQPGAVVREGDAIATIADTRRSKAKILPHLHFSLGRPSPDLVYDSFVWNILRDPSLVTLIDPIKMIDWPLQILDVCDPFCLRL